MVLNQCLQDEKILSRSSSSSRMIFWAPFILILWALLASAHFTPLSLKIWPMERSAPIFEQIDGSARFMRYSYPRR